MRINSEEWIKRIQEIIDRDYDSYTASLHIYNDVVVRAVQERQAEIDYINLCQIDELPN
jgi:hypothetical protein